VRRSARGVLADFGSAIQLVEQGQPVPYATSSMLLEGTQEYKSPEIRMEQHRKVLLGQPVSSRPTLAELYDKNDIYALGRSLYVLMCGEPKQRVPDDAPEKFAPMPPCYDVQLSALIASLLRPDPKQRLSAEEAVNHADLLLWCSKDQFIKLTDEVSCDNWLLARKLDMFHGGRPAPVMPDDDSISRLLYREFLRDMTAPTLLATVQRQLDLQLL